MSFAVRCAVIAAIAFSAPAIARAQTWTYLGEFALNEMQSHFIGVDLDSIRTVDGLREVQVAYVSPSRRQFSGVEFDFTVEVERYDCGGGRYHKFRQDYFVIGSAATLGTFQERGAPHWIGLEIPPNVADLVCRSPPAETSGAYPSADALARAARGGAAGDGETAPVPERLGPRLTDLLGPELK